MICPACNEHMIVVEYREIELDICVACHGVWFDADELALLLGRLDLRADELGRPLPGKSAEKARKCPYCRTKMLKVLMGPGEGVVIDDCPNGHGLWFDGGELDVVIAGLQAAGVPPKAAGVPHEAAGGSPEAAAKKESGEVGSFLRDVLLAGDETDKEGGKK